MKRTIFSIVMMLATTVAVADEPVKKLPDGTRVINTTELCKVRGYNATTPLEVYVKKGKIVKIVALPNRETPKFFNTVTTKLFPQYINLTVAKAKKLAASGKIDGCSGATYSAKAVVQNIKAALEVKN